MAGSVVAARSAPVGPMSGSVGAEFRLAEAGVAGWSAGCGGEADRSGVLVSVVGRTS